jgi:tetratricopeptide (TPR) repeat protein
MAGVYTDNQPDFSFLQPGETKTWSQYWYPIQKMGVAQQANLDAAVNLVLGKKNFQLGICVTRSISKAVVRLERADGSSGAEWDVDLAPGKPFVLNSRQARKPWMFGDTVVRLLDGEGREIISYQPKPRVTGKVPAPASEPPTPEDIASADELYITGLHLEQYRHATRSPTLYWREALRRDPGDARCNNAMGLWHLRRGEFADAEGYLRKAIERLTRRNANPYDGEAYYNLGLCLRYLDRDDEAYDALYKATWNQAWVSASYHALAEIDCTRKRWIKAVDHLDRSLRFDTDNLRARNLKTLVLRKLGRVETAHLLLEDTRRMDRLDWWARHIAGEEMNCDLQAQLDIAHDYARAGFYNEAIGILERAPALPRELPDQSLGALPLVCYALGWLEKKRGDDKAALRHFKRAAQLPSDYCFPARLEEIAILLSAMQSNPRDARAPYYLGNLLYDRRRHEEAIRLWERSASLDAKFSITWRNLGIGYFNIMHNPNKARAAYERAFEANPRDAHLLFERDQLLKRVGETPVKRLAELQKYPELVRRRDDLSVELCALFNQVGRYQEALDLLSKRNFQPWEGGEGGPLGQHIRSHLALGRGALADGNSVLARDHFAAALAAPENLGEAKHLLMNQSDIHYWLGCAWDALGDKPRAGEHWNFAASFKGDFQEMSVRSFSEMTYFSAMASMRLGQKTAGRKLLKDLLAYARDLANTPARIDYFATSLPTLLLFDDDLQRRQETTALFLEAQAHFGLGRKVKARTLLRTVLRRDPNHALAADHLREL